MHAGSENLLARGEVMKRIFIAIVATAALALAVTSSAVAQLPGTSMRAFIPFAFVVNGRTLPAGNYEVKRITEGPEGLIIRSVDDKHDHAVFERSEEHTSELQS